MRLDWLRRPRVCVALALEEAGGIEGAAALEISFTAIRAEAPQRHCARRASSSSRPICVVRCGTWHRQGGGIG
jgi:hypothetical protein